MTGSGDPGLRNLWRVELRQYAPELLVYIDETFASGRSSGRKRGWSPIGFPLRVPRSGLKGSRCSILPALTIDGYLALDIFEGSFNTERFNDFIRCHVLPRCGAHGEPRSVLVIDNCSTHHSEV